MRIFIFVGMPGSGKNIARLYAEGRNLPYYATGDLVREEVSHRGLAPDAENIGRVSTELRGEDGLGVTRFALAAALKKCEPIVFMEGMRSWPEIQLIRREVEATVVAFLASREVRLKRILARGRSDDSPEMFDKRDMREISYGAAVPIGLADEYLLNTGSLEEAFDAFGAMISGLLPCR